MSRLDHETKYLVGQIFHHPPDSLRGSPDRMVELSHPTRYESHERLNQYDLTRELARRAIVEPSLCRYPELYKL